jgi:hypothetical protein
VANPITILIQQAAQPAGTPGVSRDDLIVGALCTVTDPANTGGTWAWVLVVPNGSSTTGAGGATATFTFTPDKAGTYLIYLTYDDGTEVLSYVVDAVGQLITDQGGAGVKDANGFLFPGFGETQQFGLRGWDPAVDSLLRETSALKTAPPTHAGRHLTAGGDGLTLTDEEIAIANKDGVAGTASMRTLGTGAQQAAAGNQAPASHAPSHRNAGADTLAADVVRTTTDTTDMVVGAVADGQYLKRDGSTLVGGTPPGGTTAEALGTTGADVDVVLAAPPTAGQVLKADDPTHATWQDAADPGVVAAAQGSYIQAKLSSDQTSAWAADVVVLFDTAYAQRGGLAVNGSGRFSGLKAGRTYLLLADIALRDGQCRLPWKWYDVTNAADLGSSGTSVASSFSSVTAYGRLAEVLITPTEDIEVEVRAAAAPAPAVSCSVSSDGWSDHATTAMIIEIGAVQANVIGGLEYMDTIEVGSDQTSVSFGASGDGVLQRALDGEVDGEYVLVYHFTDPEALSAMELRPNGLDPAVATDFLATRVWDDAAGSQGSAALSTWQFTGLNTGYEESGELHIQNAATGLKRSFTSQTGMSNDTELFNASVSGFWDDVATVISTLEIHASVASSIKVGSKFVLYRRTRNNVRADSASTYERNVEATVAQGTAGEVEYTTGHATYQGSVIGLSVSLNDVVTVGSVTVNLKIGGVTKLTAVLDPTDAPSFNRAIEAINVHKVAPGDAIEVGIATDSLTTTGAGTPGITVNVTLTNEAVLASIAGIIDSHNLYTKSQSVKTVDLGDISGATPIDALASNTFKAVATGAAVIGAPSDMDDGWTVVLRVTQGGVANYAITFNAVWDWGSDGAPDTSGDALNTLLLVSGSSDGAKIFASWKKGFTG